VKLALLLAAAFAGAVQAPADRDRPSTTPEARAAIHAFGGCVARRSPELAAATLARDFTTRAYRSNLRNLARANESCFRERGVMRTEGLPLAGAIAEALLAADAAPLNARLARAALGPATPARSASDGIAICIVRSAPDEVARLFASEVASDREAAALAPIAPLVSACNSTGQALEATPAGLRAMLATAAYRSLRDAASSAGAGN